MDHIDNPLRFQGQYYDEETGLHYNRRRYYNPQTGRYLTPDPIGLAGGVNGYLYGVDPLGLAACCPEGGGGLIPKRIWIIGRCRVALMSR
ncbi:RHS repeat-associated core domain-containing protein [Pseudomonas entomophila]|nr:RHS repeat-associated core domain-containing protein [Pseudomonas entomophila]